MRIRVTKSSGEPNSKYQTHQQTQRRFHLLRAAQLSFLTAGDSGRQQQAVLQSRLSCYNFSFAPVRLSNGTSLSSDSTLGDLPEVSK